ncbi:Neuroligin-4, X-linked [Tyrophagus putrescentiae]|nr:Neuroligin-4, X-linked [Tyrophagus putrescentiae]
MKPTCCPPLTTALLIIISVVNFFRCTEAAQNVLQPTEVISLKSGGKVRGFVQSVVDLGRGQQKQQQKELLVNVSTFIGIQYATARRFEKPKSVAKLSEISDTVQEVTRYRFACPQEHLSQLGSEEQLSSQPPEANQTRYASEDCLYLNIWSPRRGGGNESSAEEEGPLPVMVWLHDGTESARDHLLSRSTIFSKAFDGRRLAATGNVVVISAAYRVGVFGYLYLEEGGDGDGDKEDHQTGNFALYDQLAALRWVKENVHLFNGDPKRVTIFGDSGGGAASVGILVLSPKADDLFKRAILQSGSPLTVVDDHHSAAAKTRLLSSMVGCKNSKKLIKCFQTKPMLELLNASLAMAEVGLHFRPVFGEGKAGEDSSLLPRSPLDLLLSKGKKKEKTRKVDLLFGITANEGSPAIYDLYPQLDVNESLSVEEAEQLLSNLMHLLRVPFLEEVLDFYLDDLNANSQHQANESELRRAIENAYGDLTTVVPTILFAQLLYRHYQRIDKNSSGRFYAYHLGQPLPPTSSSGCLPWMGVCSGSTVEFIFGTFLGGGDDEHGDDNGTGNELGAYSQLSRTMMTAWASFAQSGQPRLLPKDLKAAAEKDEEIKWAEAFNSSSKVGSGDNSNQQSLINFMNLKVGDFQQVQEDLLLNNEQNCSEIAFWADKLITMYSSNSGAEDDDD